MGISDRKEREKELLRREILEAARELFTTEDYRSITIRRIAEKIEYSHTTVYLHFKDKRDVLYHLIREGFQKLGQLARASITDDPVESLRRLGQVYLEFARDEPQDYRLMFQTHDPELQQLCSDNQEETFGSSFEALLAVVARLRASGRLKLAYSDTTVAHLLWASLHGVASLIQSCALHKLPDQEQAEFPKAMLDTMLAAVVQP